MIWLLWLTLAALAGPGVVRVVDEDSAERLLRGQRLALLVGPPGYEDERFPDLRYTVRDATALDQALKEQGGFDQTWTLTAPEGAQLTDVRGAMREISAAARSPDDTIFVYFSTHGTLDRDGQGEARQYLVLEDTRLDAVADTALSHDDLLDWLEALPSRRKVLVLASCHSGSGKSALPGALAAQLAGTKGAVPPLRSVSEAIVQIGVCAWNETARESDELGHDIYTWFFLEALRKADLDGDGAVTVTEAHDHARRKTYRYTEGSQRPYARMEMLGGDPIVLAGQQGLASAAAIGSYRQNLDGHRVFVDGTEKGVLPDLVGLDPGGHIIELRTPDGVKVLARRRVDLDAGGRLDLETLIRRDKVRLGAGLGYQGLSAPGAGGPLGTGELHLPRFPGRGWELVGHGSVTARWPRPTLEGGLTVERPLTPGAFHVRGGAGLEGFLLGASGDNSLLTTSLVPVPVLSTMWLGRRFAWARLSASGGYLWYTTAEGWHHGWTTRVGLTAGIGL